ncbi:MAG: tetratricopeptide repeat protein [Verrucomicrobia bacterium]|nr:tetratricopeptide repeat protein [Verrucomicrobiota bacterium]
MSEGVERFAALVEKDPRNHLARFSLAKNLYDAGSFAQAAEHFGLALQARPDWMMARILLGKCQLAQGDRDQARLSFQEGLRLAIAQSHEGPKEELETLLKEMAQA